MKLTKANMPEIEAAFAISGKTDKTYFDDQMPGFGLRMRVSGARAWVVHYDRGGKQRKLTLGTPALLTADEARFLARRHLSEANLGRDPQAEKAEERAKARVTLRSVAEQYLRFKQNELRPKSLRDARYYLLQTWKPLHDLPVHKIARRDVASVLRDVASNAPVAAVRARSNLSAMFAWAIGEDLAEDNPVVGTNRPVKEEPRDRVLTDAELAVLWGACRDDTSGQIVKLLILTGQRREEVGGMTWDELKDKPLWILPASRTKNRREHTLTLPMAAWSIIEQIPRREFNDHLFGRSSRGFDNWHKAKTLLDQRCRIAPWRFHDLRRTCATGMAELGIQPHIIETVLNHISGHKAGVAGVYNLATYKAEVRNALAIWADHVASIVSGEERKILQFPAETG
jgi:integrase